MGSKQAPDRPARGFRYLSVCLLRTVRTSSWAFGRAARVLSANLFFLNCKSKLLNIILLLCVDSSEYFELISANVKIVFELILIDSL
jgi:hypothetical protein